MLHIEQLRRWYGVADEALANTIYASYAPRCSAGIKPSCETMPEGAALLRETLIN